MHSVRATLSLAAVLLLGGCGTSAQDEVRTKVDQFVTAAAHGNYTAICDQVLSIGLLEHLAATGISCQAVVQSSLGGVSNPTLSIGRVTVSGQKAKVITLTSAHNQRASLDEIDLVREGGGWRISALQSPSAASLSGH